jgi:viologen exporter family transport system permease protein
MLRETRFLKSLWKANLLSVMEFRGAFIWQVVGMMLNNAFYFVFWVIFFDQFKQIRGWDLSDMFILFGITSASFGLISLLFGNAFNLSEIIVRGRLDYYLSFPRPVLLHALASRSIASGLGDFTYGILSFIMAGIFTWSTLGRFLMGVVFAAIVFVSFLVIVQSLAFWLGNTSTLGNLFMNAILTFALYPTSLFDGPAKIVLFTIVPAMFMGALPAILVTSFSWKDLGILILGALMLFALALLIFHGGLRRYESGSAIQTEV